MNQEQELENQILEGQKAENLLNNPMLKGWLLSRKASLFDSFNNTKADDDDLRRLIWLKMQVLTELEQDLRQTIEGGKIAKSTLKEFINSIRGRR